MIETISLNKSYKGRNGITNALIDINISIPESQYIAIVGKSGSGKSTLLKILGLMDFDFEGEMNFFGEFVKEMNDSTISDMRKNIGFIFQDFQLIERYTVKRNMEIALKIKDSSLNNEEIINKLTLVGVQDKIDSYPDELSGGQKQRVAIARAILSKPKVIIADEPTGSVDYENAIEIMDIIKKIHETEKATIILVTHDKKIAREAERRIELEDGVVICDEIFD